MCRRWRSGTNRSRASKLSGRRSWRCNGCQGTWCVRNGSGHAKATGRWWVGARAGDQVLANGQSGGRVGGQAAGAARWGVGGHVGGR
eukprot:1834080-Alexandrium_andersonii.AAC.1